MKRFEWRLQRVLDIKSKEEQIRKAELLEITEKLAQTQSELIMQRRLLRNVIESLAEVEAKNRLVKQEFFLKCSRTSDELIRNLERKVKDLSRRQREKIAEVVKLKRFKEGLEKLREEAKREFIKEQEGLEQREIDDMTTVGFARKIMQRVKEESLIN